MSVVLRLVPERTYRRHLRRAWLVAAAATGGLLGSSALWGVVAGLALVGLWR